MLSRPIHEKCNSERVVLISLVQVYLASDRLHILFSQLNAQQITHEVLILADFVGKRFLRVVELQVHDLLLEFLLKEPGRAPCNHLLEVLCVEYQVYLGEGSWVHCGQVVLQQLPRSREAVMRLLQKLGAVLLVLKLHAAFEVAEGLNQTWQVFNTGIKLLLCILSEGTRIVVEGIPQV